MNTGASKYLEAIPRPPVGISGHEMDGGGGRKPKHLLAQDTSSYFIFGVMEADVHEPSCPNNGPLQLQEKPSCFRSIYLSAGDYYGSTNSHCINVIS